MSLSLNSSQAALLNSIYRDPDSHGYMGGATQIFTLAHRRDQLLTKQHVRNWLLAQPSYALAPPMRYKTEKERIIVYNRNDLGAADLAEFQPLSRFNNGVHYVLVYRNCFTKRISVGFLKSKHADECARVFRDMLINQIKFVPRTLVTDHGGEFLNPLFRGVCAEFNIKMFQPRKGKAVHAENAILYLKTRLYRYMRDTGNKRYMDILPQIVANYNNTVRPSIGVAPNQVEAHNQYRIFHRMFGKYVNTDDKPLRPPRFAVGDIVRVRLEARTFEKSYFHKFSTELYKITAVFTNSTPPKYNVQQLTDSTVQLRLLERELLSAPINQHEQSTPTEIGLHRQASKRRQARSSEPVARQPPRKMATRRDRNKL